MRIAIEESSGVFATFKESACNYDPTCNEFKLTNEFDPAQKKLITKLDIPYKQRRSIDQVKLQHDYSALIDALSWVVKRQFTGTLEVNTSDNTPSSTNMPTKKINK